MSEQNISDSLENLSYEDRTFAPSNKFAESANIKSDIERLKKHKTYLHDMLENYYLKIKYINLMFQ